MLHWILTIWWNINSSGFWNWFSEKYWFAWRQQTMKKKKIRTNIEIETSWTEPKSYFLLLKHVSFCSTDSVYENEGFFLLTHCCEFHFQHIRYLMPFFFFNGNSNAHSHTPANGYEIFTYYFFWLFYNTYSLAYFLIYFFLSFLIHRHHNNK